MRLSALQSVREFAPSAAALDKLLRYYGQVTLIKDRVPLASRGADDAAGAKIDFSYTIALHETAAPPANVHSASSGRGLGRVPTPRVHTTEFPVATCFHHHPHTHHHHTQLFLPGHLSRP